jgi:DNA segregation ATPase FtsK/SpoIIIE, S-DNA-T family
MAGHTAAGREDLVDDAGSLALPGRAAAPPRPGIPWIASAVPVVGALGFWALSGSGFALWFALLGPIIAVAGVLDAARAARREQRESRRRALDARERVGARLAARHAADRRDREARHPDVRGFLTRPEQIWRPLPERSEHVVLGRGEVASSTRVSATGDDDDDLALVRASQRLADAPVVAPLSGVIAIVGPPVPVRAAARALVLQAACAHPPGRLEVTALPTDEEWARTLPHVRRAGGVRLAWGGGARAAGDADVGVVELRPGEALPSGCTAVIELTGLGRARWDADGARQDLAVESIGIHQARILATHLAERAGHDDGAGPVPLAGLRERTRIRDRDSLAVRVGRRGDEACTLDLVGDGPHAVVTGMTGAGKSELLVTWVLALCARYTTADLAVLLVDFKGGTAFEPLREVPHVTGVVTDLDVDGAVRAIESLRAEIRARESALAAAGRREIAQTDVPRLVVVVDEYAALREAHPDLDLLFADIAARGRALGIHLILGTQRAAGVFRESLIANCPLRISLRVADPHDSRAVVGTSDAAALPGDGGSRGLALVRRAADARAERVRIALSDAQDVVAASTGAGERPRTPWLPPLPALIRLEDVRADHGVVLGMRDEPEHQRQTPWVLADEDRGLLVIGGAASGKTTLTATVAAQAARVLRIGPDPEQAWDALCAAAMDPPPPGTTVILDDLDALGGRLPDEYARAASAIVEQLVREAGSARIRVIVTAQRLAGVAARVAELLPRRVLLPGLSASEWAAVGGRGTLPPGGRPPGRGTVDGGIVQVALPKAAPAEPVAPVPLWHPPAGVSAYIAPRSARSALARWELTGARVRSIDDVDPLALGGSDEPVVVVGDPEQWFARPRVLERVRAGHDLVVDAACGRDLRLLTGERDLPPYLAPGRGRAWWGAPGHGLRRVAVVPAS